MKKILLSILNILYQILILPYTLYKAIQMQRNGFNEDLRKEMKKRMELIFEILKQDGWIEPEILLTFNYNDDTSYYFDDFAEDEHININFVEVFLYEKELEQATSILRVLDSLYLEMFLHEIGHYIDRTNQDLEDFILISVEDKLLQLFYRVIYNPNNVEAQQNYKRLNSEKIADYYGLDIYNYLKDTLNEELFEYLLAPFQKS